MDLEQLRAILDTIGVATESAKVFGLYWLSINLLEILLGYALAVFGIVLASRIIGRLITIYKEDMEENSFLLRLREIVIPAAHGGLVSSEKDAILDAVVSACRSESTHT